MTLYGADSFFVDNPLSRYAISSWMPLRPNADGSIDIDIQHDPPGKDRLGLSTHRCPSGYDPVFQTGGEFDSRTVLKTGGLGARSLPL